MLHRGSRPIGGRVSPARDVSDDDCVSGRMRPATIGKAARRVLMQAFFTIGSLAVVVPLVLVAAGIAFAWGRLGRRELLEERDRLQVQLETRRDTSDEQVKRAISKMRREQATVSNLALALPAVVRNLNRDDLDPADVPPLILQLAEALFNPRRILLYGFRNGDHQERTLFLSAHRGLKEVPPELREVRLDQGKIGWVARNELDMLQEDWETLKIKERVEVSENAPGLPFEIIGPLVHHSKQGPQVLGVLCLGDLQNRPREEKLMLQMVTNFGSLGLITAHNLKRLRKAARYDGLTGLLNKKFFLEQVATSGLVACERRAQPFSIFIFDIDHFKTFNDTNGHPAGDALLRQMGQLIRGQLRAGDLACRYGGEEFVIALPNTDAAVAVEVAERLRRTIEAEPFDHRQSQPAGFVSISGGVAAFPQDGSSVTELIARADEALYRSKKGGRNRVTRFKGVEIGDAAAGLPPLIERR